MSGKTAAPSGISTSGGDVGVLLAEGVERRLNGRGLDLDGGAAGGVLPHRRRDVDLDRHKNSKKD
jgi:hypothetical protein